MPINKVEVLCFIFIFILAKLPSKTEDSEQEVQTTKAPEPEVETTQASESVTGKRLYYIPHVFIFKSSF